MTKNLPHFIVYNIFDAKKIGQSVPFKTLIEEHGKRILSCCSKKPARFPVRQTVFEGITNSKSVLIFILFHH